METQVLLPFSLVAQYVLSVYSLVSGQYCKTVVCSSSGVCFFLVSLACGSPSWLPCLLRRAAPNPRIQRSEFVNSYQQQPVCCLVLFFFFLYSESVSGLVALHTVPNSGFVHTLPTEQVSSPQQIFFLRGHDPYTLACKARPSFDGCRTSLSVSLSLSLSLSLVCILTHHRRQVCKAKSGGSLRGEPFGRTKKPKWEKKNRETLMILKDHPQVVETWRHHPWIFDPG